jgi:hypothetical protein
LNNLIVPVAELDSESKRYSIVDAIIAQCKTLQRQGSFESVRSHITSHQPPHPMNVETINSSTYGFCTFEFLRSSLIKTASTSRGGFKPRLFARFHRRVLSMPKQG